MDEIDSDQLRFRGQDSTECEDFITAILKRAFAQGKQRDDQWMADLAATCMMNDALRWWSSLDKEVRGNWELLRPAMLSKYRPIFHGGSGEEVEKFIRAVRDKAIDEGKRKDNEWIVTYAESCLAGEALRWYAYLDADTQENWKKLQQALLVQYPRAGADGPAPNLIPTPPAAASLAPAPKVTCRGRIRFSKSSSAPSYLSKSLPSDGRLVSTSSLADALELEWSTSSEGLQTLSIPGSQIPGYDLLGLRWRSDDLSDSNRYLAFCAVESQTNSTNISACSGRLLTTNWKISPADGGSSGIMTISVTDGTETLYPRWGASVWFSANKDYRSYRAECFFDLI